LEEALDLSSDRSLNELSIDFQNGTFFESRFDFVFSLFVARLFVRSVFNAAISNSEYSIERVDDIEYLMYLKTIKPIHRGLCKVSSQHFL
jgi:hypothetical protein